MEDRPAQRQSDLRPMSGARPGILINRDFALLWSGLSISVLGNVILDTTLVLWIAARLAQGRPWAPLAISGVMAAVAIPDIAVGPLAGVFVDRWNKRRTMMVCDGIRMVLILVLLPATGLVRLPFLTVNHQLTWKLGTIYTVVLLASVLGQFFSPARMVLIRDLVPNEYQARASSLSQVTMTLAMIVGPPLAAPILFGLGVQWALVLDAASFAVSFLAIFALRVQEPAEGAGPSAGGVFRELQDGLRFFSGSSVLVTVLVAGVLFNVGSGAIDTLDVFFTTQNLHASMTLYGFLGGALGAGALLGAVLSGAFANRVDVSRMLSTSLIAVGIIVLIYSRLAAFWPAVAVLFLAGIPMAAVNVAFQPIVLFVTPRDLVGRVFAVISPITSAANLISVGLAGYLASTLLHGLHVRLLDVSVGPVDTIFFGTGLLVLAAGLYALRNLPPMPRSES